MYLWKSPAYSSNLFSEKSLRLDSFALATSSVSILPGERGGEGEGEREGEREGREGERERGEREGERGEIEGEREGEYLVRHPGYTVLHSFLFSQDQVDIVSVDQTRESVEKSVTEPPSLSLSSVLLLLIFTKFCHVVGAL